MDDSMRVSSYVCGEAFSQLIGYVVCQGIFAGVKQTPASVIPRLAIYAAVQVSALASEKYSEWCYEVGDAVASKFRKGWYWFKYRNQEKIPKDVFEELYGK